MEAIGTLHESAELSFILQRECRLLELGHHGALLEGRQFAALLCAAGIVRVLFRELFEVTAVLDLIQQPFSFPASGVNGLLIYFAVRTGRRRLDKNVPN